MTNNNEIRYVYQVPRTFQVAELKGQQRKESSLSVAARAKVINRSGSNYVGENREQYGPCSYSDCPYDTPFDISISIEGLNRKWARRPHTATFLPGNWEWAPLTSNYLYRTDLWLTNLDQGRRVCPLLSNDDVYAVNLWGKHCSEDSKFCNAAREIIQGAVRSHENGQGVCINETLDSDDYRRNKQVVKIVAAAGASVVNPGAVIAAGATVWGAGKIGHAACDTERGKRFWGDIRNVGGDNFWGGVSGAISGGIGELSSDLGKYAGGSLRNQVIDSAKDAVSTVASDIAKHEIHRANGEVYDSDCPICNQW